MRYAIIKKDDETIIGLANRLFQLKGRGSQAAIREAAETLMAANPDLTDFSKVAAGSLIEVPDSLPAIEPGEEAAAPPGLSSSRLQSVTSVLQSAQANFTEIEDRMMARLEASLQQISSATVPRELAKVLDQAPVQGIFEQPDTQSVIAEITQSISALKDARAAREASMMTLQSSLKLAASQSGKQ